MGLEGIMLSKMSDIESQILYDLVNVKLKKKTELINTEKRLAVARWKVSKMHESDQKVQTFHMYL